MNTNEFISGVDSIVSSSLLNYSILEGNEAQTRWLLIDTMLLDLLGYSREEVILEYNVDSEDRVSAYSKLDYCITLNNKPKLLVEAKSFGSDLYSHFSQLEYYFTNIFNSGSYFQKELLGVLTDGDLYLFYSDIKSEGTLDRYPFFTLRLSLCEDNEKIKLLNYSKNNLLLNHNILAEDTIDYDLSEYYRIDCIEQVYNYYDSLGKNLNIDSIYLSGRLLKPKSFRDIYSMVLNTINTLQPNLIHELAYLEDKSSIEGSIIKKWFSLNAISSNDIQLKTSEGIVYISYSTRTRNIDRIVSLLSNSKIGLASLSIRLSV